MLSTHPAAARGAVAGCGLSLPNILGLPCAERSEATRAELEERCRRERVERVVFSSRGGLGFRAIQAKRAGLAFADTVFAVRLDGTASQQRERDKRLISHLDEAEEDFAERYSFEHADERIIDDERLMAMMRERGWRDPTPQPPPRSGEGETTGCRLAEGRSTTRVADTVQQEWSQHPPRSTLLRSPLSASGRGLGGGVVPLVTVCVPHYNLGRHLPQTLASIAAQDHPALEAIVIDDGSTDEHSKRTFDRMENSYPRFTFLRQSNAGIGATRNRGLALARGEYFLPVDADNILKPEMVSRLVAGMRPGIAALSCYFLAFEKDEDIGAGRFLYAGRPMGGPFALACWKNVYGDACSLYRTAEFRQAGGYEEDRGTSFEDWEAFVKLAGRGFGVDVVPDHLFYYRHLAAGFSRATDGYGNLQRVLRRLKHADALPLAERELAWQALAGLAHGAERQRAREARWPHRLLRRAWDMAKWLGGGQARRPSG